MSRPFVDDVREKVSTPVFAGSVRHGVGNGEIIPQA